MIQTGQYIFVETLISCIINALFSFGFTYAAFHTAVSILQHDLMIDAIPQSFAVSFFAVFPATLLTRKRLVKGKITALEFNKNKLPVNAFLRAIAIAVVMAILGFAGHYIVFNVLNIQQVSLTSALVYKTLYGIGLTLAITPIALKCALSEVQSTEASRF